MEDRELRALQIAAKSKLTRRGEDFVCSFPIHRGAQYIVKLDPEEPECSCPDFECRKQRCKHIFAVEYTIEGEPPRSGRHPIIPYSPRFKLPNAAAWNVTS